jgi:Holliday junction resolvase
VGASQRRKGASGERELCGILSDALGFNVSRILGQARDSGHDIDVPGFSIEVKRRQRIALLYSALAQAMNGKGTPALMLRADGKEWLVVMHLPDFIKLAREEIVSALPPTP